MKRSCHSNSLEARSECCEIPSKISKPSEVSRQSELLYGYSEEELKNVIPADEIKLLETSNITNVDALLARWWRRRSRDSSKGLKLTATSVSPSTRLRQICRYREKLYTYP